ncbi:peptidoglycan-binding protein [Ectobacillus funiculus]
MNADGSLQLTGQLDPNFINQMHEKGIKVVPFLSNHWDRNLGRAALQNREQLATQIADAIVKYNLDGVQIDIENVTEVDRDNYTDLVRLLREKLPKEKEVSVAVAANPYGWTKGWHGSYDYQSLAKYASYLMIMTYDQSYEGSPEGPVASYDWVEKSIQYALNQGLSPNQIVLGIPFYGRYWMEGNAAGGYGISNSKVIEMVKRYNGQVIFDEASKSPKAIITIKEGDPTTVVGGKVLQPGTYHIWFENEQSISAKTNLLHKYNLKGTGSWSLGQEDIAIWNQYHSWMTSHGTTEDTKPVAEANLTSYVVMPGDTLSKISVQFGLTVAQLKTYNNLTSDMIHIGQMLRLTPSDTILVAAPVPAPAEAKPTQSTVVTPIVPPVVSKPAVPQAAPKKNDVLIKMGQRGASVTSLQQSLQKLGLYKGEIDGIYGKGTQAAILAFQKAQKLPQTGNYDTFTKEKMDSVLKQTAVKLTTAVKPTAVTYPAVQVGSRGANVTQLQQDLKKVGLYSGKIDGIFGNGTKTAVLKFQQKYKLKETGKADAATQAKMNEVLKR